MSLSDKAIFAERGTTDDIETGCLFTPKFDENGVLPVVATDAATGEVLMLAYMNEEALAETIKTRRATYWSRSRKQIWRKGETSGNVQHVVEIRTDCDQDAIWIRVKMDGHGAACHVGHRSCFYRSIPEQGGTGRETELRVTEDARIFDPDDVYGDVDGDSDSG